MSKGYSKTGVRASKDILRKVSYKNCFEDKSIYYEYFTEFPRLSHVLIVIKPVHHWAGFKSWISPWPGRDILFRAYSSNWIRSVV